METTHRTLVRSSVLVAVASAAVPVTLANADTTFYTDQATFETAAADAGMAQLYMETFEENTISGPYAIMTPPLCGGVANTGYPNGLDAEGLCLDSDDGGNLATILPSAYWENITSAATGTFSDPSHTIVEFEGGVPAVGLRILGIDSFISNPVDEVEYTVYDPDGGVLQTGIWPAPDALSGTFFGLMSTEPIGSIKLRGLAFTLDTQEYVDDIQAWDSGGLVGDVNGDGVVDFGDILLVLAEWGTCEGCPEDVNGDGSVDFGDILVILANWTI